MERLIACILIAALALPTMSCAEVAGATAVGVGTAYELEKDRLERKEKSKEAAMERAMQWPSGSPERKRLLKEIEKSEKNERKTDKEEIIVELVIAAAVTALILGAAVAAKMDQEQQDGASAERAPRRNQVASEDAQPSFAGGYIHPGK